MVSSEGYTVIFRSPLIQLQAPSLWEAGLRSPIHDGTEYYRWFVHGILNISFLSEANRAYPYLNANFLVKTLPC